MMYKSLHSLAPQYLTRKFKYVRDNHNCNTRQAAAGQLALPPLTHGNDIECFKSSFSYSGVKLWNGIDSTVRNSQDIGSFKDMYKRHYFKQWCCQSYWQFSFVWYLVWYFKVFWVVKIVNIFCLILCVLFIGGYNHVLIFKHCQYDIDVLWMYILCKAGPRVRTAFSWFGQPWVKIINNNNNCCILRCGVHCVCVVFSISITLVWCKELVQIAK